ncbi:hypothetical protein ANCDUO_18332, partial [Ancylostoma duodenale]
NNRLVTYVHSLDNEHRTPVLTHALINDAYNATFYNAVTYGARAGCSYSWASQTFSCPNGASDMNELTITHIGEDVFGNLFQRVTTAHCSKEVITCNGGVRWQGQCICTEYWTVSQSVLTAGSSPVITEDVNALTDTLACIVKLLAAPGFFGDSRALPQFDEIYSLA